MQRFFPLLLAIVLSASACSSTTTTTTTASVADESSEAATSNADGDSTDAVDVDADEPTPAPTAEATAVPEPTEAPEPTAAPEATAAPETDEATRMLERSSLGDDLSPSEIACVVKGLADQPDLFANAVSGTDFDQLPIDDQVDTALIALDCAPDAAAAQFTDGFTNSVASAQPAMGAELGLCLVGQLDADNPNRREVLMGFASLGEDVPVPAEAEEALVDSITTCIPGPVFAELMISEFADDPQMASALDTECIRGAFPDETMRLFWGAMINDGGSIDDVDPEATGPLMSAMFSCLSMGQIMADQAALGGTVLSEETIACIDTELTGETIAAMMTGSDAEGEAQVTAIVLGCLSPEELAGLGG